MYFVSIYENRRMKPAEIGLRKGERRKKKMMKGVKLRYIVNTYVNFAVYPE
jgi:hypothetical protein